MSWRNFDFKLLIVAAVVSGSLPFLLSDLGYAPSGIFDPAIEFYTKTHSDSYGGLDRWAHHGMKPESLVELLKRDGFDCLLPQASGAGIALSGTHELACVKKLDGMLERTLSIKATIDYDIGGRLVSAHASSKLASDDQSFRKHIAGVLRRFDWIEPEVLQIKGFEIDSIDLLTRLAVDALSARGWHKICEDDISQLGCLKFALERRASGFPQTGEGAVAVDNVSDLHSAMGSIHLVALQSREYPKSDETLFVRVVDEKMWIDFAGKDLAGRELMVSVEIDSEGGAPARLIAKVGSDSRETVLAGARRLANNGMVRYFVPLAGSQNPRLAVWRNLPNKNSPDSYAQLSNALINVDPAFSLRIIKVILADIASSVSPEEGIGLYPVLRSAEYQAEILRSAHAERWIPKETGVQAFARKMHPDDPVARASWALAMCESATRPLTIDENCFRNFIWADPDVAALLSKEVADLQGVYASLELTHPLWLRLKRLGGALHMAGQESSEGVQRPPAGSDDAIQVEDTGESKGDDKSPSIPDKLL